MRCIESLERQKLRDLLDLIDRFERETFDEDSGVELREFLVSHCHHLFRGRSVDPKILSRQSLWLQSSYASSTLIRTDYFKCAKQGYQGMPTRLLTSVVR